MPAPPPLSFLQAGCPSCHPSNSVKALKANKHSTADTIKQHKLLHNFFYKFLISEKLTTADTAA